MENGSASYHLCSLREDVLVEVDQLTDDLQLTTFWGDITITDPSHSVRVLLERMAMGPVRIDNVVPASGPERHQVERILSLISGCVVHSLGHDHTSGDLLSAVPIARRARFELPQPQPQRPIRLSRFATMRTSDGNFVLESPLARHRVVLHRPVAAELVTLLSDAVLPSEVGARIEVDPSVVLDMIGYLIAAGMVVVSTGASLAGARFAEDDDPVLAPWTHHELLFHSRSRIGRHDSPLGVMPLELRKVEMAPPVKPVPAGPKTLLYRPALEDLFIIDPPFTAVLESNRFVRDFSAGEPTAQQLGELLFRTARVRKTASQSDQDTGYGITDRPYPSVASRYELDLYVTVNRCAGLTRGIYHYDPQDHLLTLINSSETELGELLDMAMIAAGSPNRPPVLVTMTARMARFACIYGGIAYSTVLEHVGVLQQTLHLVATAMGLGPCALAFGDSEIANEAFHIEWPAEVSVGELALGIRPPHDSSIARSAENSCFTNVRRRFAVTDKLAHRN